MKNGDDLLNANQRRLWELHQHVLWKWGTYCLFTHRRVSVPSQLPEEIVFMVPKDATHRYEIEDYLRYELAEFAQEPYDDDSGDLPWPGTEVHVHVVPFSGVEPYADRDAMGRIAAEGIKMFNQMLAEWKRDRKKKEDPDE